MDDEEEPFEPAEPPKPKPDYEREASERIKAHTDEDCDEELREYYYGVYGGG